jgi:hypothetical protein
VKQGETTRNAAKQNAELFFRRIAGGLAGLVTHVALLRLNSRSCSGRAVCVLGYPSDLISAWFFVDLIRTESLFLGWESRIGGRMQMADGPSQNGAAGPPTERPAVAPPVVWFCDAIFRSHRARR